MAEVTELLTKFSFEGSTQPLDNFNKGLGDAIKGLTAFATASFGALAGFGAWADSILKSIDPLEQMSRRTGIAIEDIQELGFASSVSGGSIEGMTASLEGLTERIGEAVSLGTGEGVAIFEHLGIDIEDASGKAKNAGVIFDELRQKIVEMELDETQTLSIARKLGMTPDAVQLLRATNDEMATMRERSRELGIITTEQGDAVASYNDSLTIMNTAFDGLKRNIAVGFAPELQKLAERFTDLIMTNREWLSEGIVAGINALVGFAKAFTNVASVIFKALGALLEFKPVLYGVIALGGLLAVAFAPVTVITAGLIAVILLVDDLITAFSGGKSVIGDFFMDFGINLKYVGDFLNEIWNVLKAIFTLDLGYLGDLLSFGADKLTGLFTVDQAIAPPSSNVDNRAVTQNITQNITSTDPERTGQIATEGIQRQMRDASVEIGNGGL